MAEHYTSEDEGRVGSIHTVEQARKAHRLATADPERDGTLTGPAHEEKYGLDRAKQSAAEWRAAGVHPTENRALEDGEDGYVDPETADESEPVERAVPAKPSRAR